MAAGGFAQGAAELRVIAREFRAAGPKAERLAATAVIKTLADIEGDAKNIVAVDTGYLKNSISREITADTFAGAGGQFGGEVGPTAFYGEFVEYGTSRMEPQPFMGPAFERRVPAFMAAMGKIPSLAFKRGV
jgi:HK97 gp10 family phage protein